MICSKCKVKTATIRISQVINGKLTEVFLCPDCAKENAIAGMQAAIGAANMVPGFFSYGGGLNKYYHAKAESTTRCSLCGKSFEEIQKDGRLGCATCYTEFKDKLDPIIERIYGSARHKGRCPSNMPDEYKKTREIDELKIRLVRAIESEEYEKAAEIRDSIKTLEQGQK